MEAFRTLGASKIAEIMVGIDIKAYTPSIKLMTTLKDAVAPTTIEAM